MPVVTRTVLSSLMIVATAGAAQAGPGTHRWPDPTVSMVTLKAADGSQRFHAELMNATTQAAAPKPKTVSEEFWAALAAPGGAAKARQLYDETRKKDKTTVLFPETELNQFGYQVLQEGRAKDAIIIFKMNVDEYPKSANTYDSLSDAYLADGNNAEALKYAEKAIEALATDTQAPAEFKQQVRESAEAKIKQLKKKA